MRFACAGRAWKRDVDAFEELILRLRSISLHLHSPPQRAVYIFHILCTSTHMYVYVVERCCAKENIFTWCAAAAAEIKSRAPPVHIPLLNVCVCISRRRALISRHSTRRKRVARRAGGKSTVVFLALCVRCIAPGKLKWVNFFFHGSGRWKLSCNQRKQPLLRWHTQRGKEECI